MGVRRAMASALILDEHGRHIRLEPRENRAGNFSRVISSSGLDSKFWYIISLSILTSIQTVTTSNVQLHPKFTTR